MSGCITSATVVEYRSLIVELWGELVYRHALATRASTWLEFLQSEGIM